MRKTITIEPGQRFGRLVVVRLSHKRKGFSHYLCRCDCETEITVRKDGLYNGGVKSCGCYHREASSKRARTHGMSGGALGHKGRAPEYQAWAAMLRRCYTPSTKYYENYGGRGITVCDRWRESFENFLEDMGPRPSPKHSLDRINNDGDYTPPNCRWTVSEVQLNNTRRNVLLTFNGKTQTVTQWTRELGFPRGVISSRMARGWTVERALTTPVDAVASRNATNHLRRKK